MLFKPQRSKCVCFLSHLMTIRESSKNLSKFLSKNSHVRRCKIFFRISYIGQKRSLGCWFLLLFVLSQTGWSKLPQAIGNLPEKWNLKPRGVPILCLVLCAEVHRRTWGPTIFHIQERKSKKVKETETNQSFDFGTKNCLDPYTEEVNFPTN